MLNVYTLTLQNISFLRFFLGLHFYEEAAKNNLFLTIYILWRGRGRGEARAVLSSLLYRFLSFTYAVLVQTFERVTGM